MPQTARESGDGHGEQVLDSSSPLRCTDSSEELANKRSRAAVIPGSHGFASTAIPVAGLGPMTNTRVLAIIGILLLIVLAASLFMRDTPAPLDRISAAMTPGRMVLSDNRTVTLSVSEDPKRMFVCVKPEADAVAVTIGHDGQSQLLKPRECSDFSVRRLTATPAAPLTGSLHAVVTYWEIRP